MVLFLRYYQHRERAILLDQGQIQKIWSILVDAEATFRNSYKTLLQH